MSAVHKLITDHLDIWTAADTEKKSGRGRASGNANSVYGIKKLRELILELAVRGKLVPQDPNDEPANELLKRILAERAERLPESKVKTSKQTVRDNEEFPFGSPQGWCWVRLADIATVIRGVTYSKTDARDTPSPDHVPLLRGNNINRELNFDLLVYVPKTLLKEEQFIMPGDIVIAMSSGSADLVGKAAQVTKSHTAGFGAFCGVARPISLELADFFGFFFQTPLYRNRAAGHGKGIGINNLQKTARESLEIPVPPLAEQQRIVAKVDELMALCDQLEAQHNNAADAHEQLVSHLLSTLTQSQDAEDFNANWQRIATHFDTLFTTESSIDALKQTLLQLAVMGKLVPQDPNDEPASELLKRIQVEKAKLVAEGKIKKEKPLTEIREDEKLFDVPIGWALVRKAAVFKFLNGYAFKSETFQSSGIKLLRNVNISHGFADWRDVAHISKTQAQEFGEYSLNVGDTVLTLDRPIITTGLKFAVISKSDLPCLLLQRVAKISSFSESVISNYLSIWLQSAFFTSKIDPGRSNGVPHISTTQVSNMLFALPPVAEQHRIIAKVNELMTLCEQLKSRITATKQCQKKLADILVERALA